jgi:hypothetical protein
MDPNRSMNAKALFDEIQALPPELAAEVRDFVEFLRVHALKAQEEDSAGFMVSLRKDITGVDNTVFVSTKGHGRHAPRIKIAIDPPDSFNETSSCTSMAIRDYSLTGAYAPPGLVEQAKAFVERNRDVLLAYWNGEFDTGELFRRLQRP